jgi:hypothetical protein
MPVSLFLRRATFEFMKLETLDNWFVLILGAVAAGLGYLGGAVVAARTYEKQAIERGLGSYVLVESNRTSVKFQWKTIDANTNKP